MPSVAPSTARRIVLRGSRASSASGAAPSKPPNARMLKTDPAMTPVIPWYAFGRVPGAEDRQRVVAARVDDQQHAEHHEHGDLEDAEDRAEPRRRTHAVEPGDHDDERAENRPRPPQVRPGSDDHSELSVDAVVNPSCSSTSGGDQGADEDVRPGDEEADALVQSLGRVGGERAGGRHVLGQLADAERAEQAGDEREDDGQRQRTAGEEGAGGDRRGDRGARCHVGDALEQHLPEPDRVFAQRQLGGHGLIDHGDLASTGMIMRIFEATVLPRSSRRK